MARKISRAKIRKDIMSQIKGKSAVTQDLGEKYLRFVELYDIAEENGEEQKMAEIAGVMAQLATALQVAPRSERRRAMEEEIRDQLAIKGIRGEVFEDKIDTFLKLWDAFQEANRNLNERGRTYFTISSAGKEYEKDNASSKDIVTFAKAMQDILDDLDVTVRGFADPEDDEF